MLTCYLLGMKANFQRLSDMLQREFPGQWSAIKGENYPPPEWTNYAIPLLSAIQFFAMVLILFGDSIWSYVPGVRRPPEFYYKMKENPALTFIIMFLVIPSYVQSFANTGAFEIYVDQKLVSLQQRHSFCVCLGPLLPHQFMAALIQSDIKDIFKIRGRENAECR
jgi:selT/selW/selH-like putative selenoprotein